MVPQLLPGGLWAALGRRGPLLGPSWGAPGSSWPPLGALLAPLGALLSRSWGLLAGSWGPVGLSWVLFLVFFDLAPLGDF